MTPAALISAFGCRLKVADVPADALAAARRSILDGLAVTVAGALTSTSSAARTALLSPAGEGPASLIGTAATTGVSTAALLNGIAAHALDYDDVWADDDGIRAWRGHPTVCVLPAVLAVAEVADAPGDAVVAGYVVGTEVAGKLGTAFGPALGRAGWHPTIVLGTVAAAAGAATVLGLSETRFQIALAIAATEAGGLHRNFGTDTKPFHAGHAARCGVDAALLASAGFTANPAALEDYLKVFGAADGAAEKTLAELGFVYDLVAPGLSIKKYPCCRFAHLPLDALFDLLSEDPVPPAAVRSIIVRIQRGADDALVCPNATTGLEGKFSMPYVMAAGVLDGSLRLGAFTDQAVARPAVRELMARVRTEYWDEPGADVEVVTEAGAHRSAATVVRGDPANPLSRLDELEKCRSCLDGVLEGAVADALVERVESLGGLGSARSLTALLTPAAVLAG